MAWPLIRFIQEPARTHSHGRHRSFPESTSSKASVHPRAVVAQHARLESGSGKGQEMSRHHALAGASVIAMELALLQQVSVAHAQPASIDLPPVTVEAPRARTPKPVRKPVRPVATAHRTAPISNDTPQQRVIIATDA